ncbi:unnamed protein product [Bursaphelenchus xylophilus]|uniref:(pine wood nematode) hypothetical protein n=1 Tax=Bursaphelenchus xylophilus TaxID=6326 RepID=A0A1I7RU23_BURXY|nr:unnamed protein product [Bursaphelenchus xylophilus]CAG9132007.1 unnamed protein product [Bursaphelenchus xylophilus]
MLKQFVHATPSLSQKTEEGQRSKAPIHVPNNIRAPPEALSIPWWVLFEMKRTFADYYEEPVYCAPPNETRIPFYEQEPAEKKRIEDDEEEEDIPPEYMSVCGKISSHRLTFIISLVVTIGSLLYLVFDVFLFAERHERYSSYDVIQTVNFGVALLLLIGNRMGCFFMYLPYLAFHVFLQIILMLIVFVLFIKSFLMAKTGDDDRYIQETTDDFWDYMTLALLLIIYGAINAYCITVVLNGMKYLRKKTSGKTVLW